MNFEKLFQTPPQTPEEKEVRDWLKKCEGIFDDEWTPIEVAHLALWLGFDHNAVYAVLSHWQDALRGSRFENRAAMMEYQMEHAVSQFSALQDKLSGKITLQEQWADYVKYATEGIEFKEVA